MRILCTASNFKAFTLSLAMTSDSLQNYHILLSIRSMNCDLQNPYHDKDHHPHCYLFHCTSHLIISVVNLRHCHDLTSSILLVPVASILISGKEEYIWAIIESSFVPSPWWTSKSMTSTRFNSCTAGHNKLQWPHFQNTKVHRTLWSIMTWRSYQCKTHWWVLAVLWCCYVLGPGITTESTKVIPAPAASSGSSICWSRAINVNNSLLWSPIHIPSVSSNSACGLDNLFFSSSK